MKSMRLLAIVWLSGVIAGVIVMERWRRHGGRYVPVESVAIQRDAPTAPPASPSLIRLIVTGAKLDAERVRQKVRPAASPTT
jgi:hypothetical protein